MSGMPLRGDRIHRYVNAFCPVCHEERPDRPLAEVQRLSGWLVERDGRVWLERGCPEHGLVRTMYDEDPGTDDIIASCGGLVPQTYFDGTPHMACGIPLRYRILPH